MTPFQYLQRWFYSRLSDVLIALAGKLNPPTSRKAGPALLPRTRVIKASFYFALPAPATEAEIEEWVKFELGGGSLPDSNPLSDQELSSMGRINLADTGLHEHLRFVGTPKKFSVFTSLKPVPYVGPTSTDIIMNPNHPALEPEDKNG